ncbi:MAG: hypothetical protein FJ257_00580 [Phycisphaerae bacterium]|nr:hypothetical protein [Phycisphaerae bacterium]
MSLELVHAWAPRGLDGGGPGFHVVARTAGMPPLAERLAVGLSGHRLDRDPRPTLALRRVEALGSAWSILSSTRPAPDAGGGPNRVAHHLLLDERDLGSVDPAALVSEWRPLERWEGPPREIAAPPPLPGSSIGGMPCAAWASATGDAGWAGEALRRIEVLGGEPLVLLLPARADPRRLAVEMLALLPRERRSSFSFADRLDHAPPGTTILCAMLDPEALAIATKPMPAGAALLDLRAPASPPASPEADAARQGRPLGGTPERPAVAFGAVEEETIEPIDDPRFLAIPIEVVLDDAPRSPRLLLAAAVAVSLLLAGLVAWLLLREVAP